MHVCMCIYIHDYPHRMIKNGRDLLAHRRDDDDATDAEERSSSSSNRGWRIHPASPSSPRSSSFHHHQKMEKIIRMKKMKKAEAKLMDMTVKELRDALREKGMPVSGVKAHLIARLLGSSSSSSSSSSSAQAA